MRIWAKTRLARTQIAGVNVLPISLVTISFLTTALLSGCSATKDQNNPKSIVDLPTGAEDELLVTAMDSYDRAIYTVAETQWTQFRDSFPTSPHLPLAEIKIADSQFMRGEYAAAVLSYEEFKRIHPGHEAVPYTVFQVGNAHLEQYEGVRRDQAPLQNAIRSFESLLASFPQSEYAILARRSLSRCRELLAEHEAYVSEFYSARGDTKAAAERKKTLFALYPESKVANELKPGNEAAQGATPSAKERSGFILGAPAVIAAAPKQETHERVIETGEITPSIPLETERVSSSKPAVLGVECGSSDGAPVFILYTRYPSIGEERDLNGGDSLRLQFDPHADIVESDREDLASNCGTEGGKISVTSDARSAEVELSGLNGAEIKVLRVTRPLRTILTVLR